ncbi:collagen alpha-1(I) chain-like [Choloepus didactylus]|uniref:collagen alpha-1(I) chain-like n=1 Tax=Choloepus didactylus TaxID=27675 RepID=UPI00189DC3D3|nr:collagen alpha-1(I) chain-like [Choloepus didactylus]
MTRGSEDPGLPLTGPAWAWPGVGARENEEAEKGTPRRPRDPGAPGPARAGDGPRVGLTSHGCGGCSARASAAGGSGHHDNQGHARPAASGGARRLGGGACPGDLHGNERLASEARTGPIQQSGSGVWAGPTQVITMATAPDDFRSKGAASGRGHQRRDSRKRQRAEAPWQRRRGRICPRWVGPGRPGGGAWTAGAESGPD